jgi:hypothetical protein
MRKALALPSLLETLTLTKFLTHFLSTAALIVVFLLLWLNTDYLNALIAPKTAGTEVTCDVQQAPNHCVINTDIGPIEVFAHSEIISLEPFTITLKTADTRFSSANIRFEGLEDYMGINQFKFSQDGNDTWHAKGSIPICTTKSKTWKVIINLYNDNNYSSYWFKMKTR